MATNARLCSLVETGSAERAAGGSKNASIFDCWMAAQLGPVREESGMRRLPALRGNPSGVAWAEVVRADDFRVIDEKLQAGVWSRARVQVAARRLSRQRAAQWWIKHRRRWLPVVERAWKREIAPSGRTRVASHQND